MAVIDQLTLSNAAPRRDTSPGGRFRRKIVEAIELQMAMAEAAASGTELKRTRSRLVKNDAGVKERRDVPLRLRPWWWTDDAGKTYLAVRHGGRPLAIAPGKTAIEVGAPADLPAKLAILRDAARAGELDGCREEVARRLPKRGDKAEGKGPVAGDPAKPSRKAEKAPRAAAG